MNKFKHKKNLGQNFLQDEVILKKISDSIATTSKDLIIEVGPGQGALTKYLSQKSGYLICYEIDERLKRYLQKYESDKCNIIYKDFLNSNLNDIKTCNYNKIYLIANLPYYITTPIIEKIINSSLNVEAMAIMVQKEVALRLAAKPGCSDYGSLTVFLNYYYEVSNILLVDRTKFYPAPNVDSAVLKLTRKKINYAIDEEKLFKFVRDCFKMKRKNLRNNLKDYDLEKMEMILKKKNLDLTIRAEQLSLEDFVSIVQEYYD